MQTLYRKYRPQDFKQIFGQVPIVKVLSKQVEDDKVGHAYMFAGPRGTGKTSVARVLSKAVNCKRVSKGNPCKRCVSCKSIEQGRFLDLIEIDAASNRGIDEIRRLRERVNFSPSEGKYKVYIIDEVHMLTKDAFNALLKTLEEPPAHIIFILATTEPDKVPTTILSRCQRFNFNLVDEETLSKRLEYICKQEKVKITNEALLVINKNAGGSFRDAESILEKVLGGMGVLKDRRIDLEDVKEILGLAEDTEVKKFVQKLLKKDVHSCLKIFDKIVSSGVNLFQFLRQTLEYSRLLLIQKVSKAEGDFSLKDLLRIITELSEAESKLKYTQVQRLPIEVAIVKITSNEEGSVYTAHDNPRSQEVQKNIPRIVTRAISRLPNKIRSSIKEKKEARVKIGNVRASWDEIVEKVRPYNHHLFAFYKKAQPVDVKGECVLLNVPFKFHKQRIESSASQEIFSQISKEIFGQGLSCLCEVKEEFIEGIDDETSYENSNIVVEVLGDMIE
ncbi:DNA polymerase III subunit gamma/tau [Candidatus Dojkabacteria bacterium]|nr:DNA polymerase III subunit gamma/tau [Candidatus Dojkabacteria bacterium]